MAFGITFLNETASGAGSASIESGSITPTANALLVAIVAVNDSGTNDITGISDTLTGTGTWTAQQNVTHNYAGASDACLAIFTAQAGSSPGSGTVTVSLSELASRRIIHVLEVTGFDTNTPVAQSANNTGTSSTSMTVTLSSSPAADSMVIAAACSVVLTADDLISPDGAYTELAETNVGGGAGGGTNLSTAYDAAGADTTADFTGLGTTADIGVAIEINLAGGGGGRTTKNTVSNPLGLSTAIGWRIRPA